MRVLRKCVCVCFVSAFVSERDKSYLQWHGTMQWEESNEDSMEGTTNESGGSFSEDGDEEEELVDYVYEEFDEEDEEEYGPEEFDSEEYEEEEELEDNQRGPNGGMYIEDEFSPDEEEDEEEEDSYEEEEELDSSEDIIDSTGSHFHPVNLPQLDSFASPRNVRAQEGRFQSTATIAANTASGGNDILLLGGLSVVGFVLMLLSRRNRVNMKLKLSE